MRSGGRYTWIRNSRRKSLSCKNGNILVKFPYGLNFEFRDQIVRQKYQKLQHQAQLKKEYRDRIERKKEEVEKNKEVIKSLTDHEKIALYTLKNTLNQENILDSNLRYDVHG